MEDSDDEEWRARRAPRKRPRVLPPGVDQPTPIVRTPLGVGSRPAQHQEQQQQRLQRQADVLAGSLRRTPSLGAGSEATAAGGTPYVCVQRVTGPKAAYQSTKVWIPRPTGELLATIPSLLPQASQAAQRQAC